MPLLSLCTRHNHLIGYIPGHWLFIGIKTIPFRQVHRTRAKVGGRDIFFAKGLCTTDGAEGPSAEELDPKIRSEWRKPQ